MSKPTPPICSYEGSDYQQHFWDEGGRAYEDSVEAKALKRLLPKEGEFLLELGAGAGRNTPRYQNFERVALLDYSRTQLEQARERLGESERYLFVAADIYDLPFVDGLFDGATMIRTLHHLSDPQLALDQISRVISPEGIFILEFANKRNLKAMLRYFFGKQSWSPYSHEPVEFAELNFDFHPKAVRDYLRQAGFDIERQLTVSHFRVEALKRNVPTRVLAGLDGLFQWTGGFLQVSPSVFTRCRAQECKQQAEGGVLFQCPICGTSLDGREQDLHCEDCGRVWEYRDGIYDFRKNPPELN
ncbi:MAG: methyltransferase domain-containing protein [Brevefilum sp.]